MKPVRIVHLYPKEMNIYGDNGNTLVLQKRLQWRGFDAEIIKIGIGHDMPKDADIIVGGGGQDAGQSLVQDDLLGKASQLREMTSRGVVMLMVCGLYQLFGRRFVTHDGIEIRGIDIFPAETVAGPVRLIGNTIYKSEWGQIVGYENHSGLTQLENNNMALARVTKGAGNNGRDKTEGCLVNNVFGTYSHGPILAKNPRLADELLRRALEQKNPKIALEFLDSSLENEASKVAIKRPR